MIDNLLTNYIIHTIYSVLYIEKKNPFEIFNISGNELYDFSDE